MTRGEKPKIKFDPMSREWYAEGHGGSWMVSEYFKTPGDILDFLRTGRASERIPSVQIVHPGQIMEFHDY